MRYAINWLAIPKMMFTKEIDLAPCDLTAKEELYALADYFLNDTELRRILEHVGIHGDFDDSEKSTIETKLQTYADEKHWGIRYSYVLAISVSLARQIVAGAISNLRSETARKFMDDRYFTCTKIGYIGDHNNCTIDELKLYCGHILKYEAAREIFLKTRDLKRHLYPKERKVFYELAHQFYLKYGLARRTSSICLGQDIAMYIVRGEISIFEEYETKIAIPIMRKTWFETTGIMPKETEIDVWELNQIRKRI